MSWNACWGWVEEMSWNAVTDFMSDCLFTTYYIFMPAHYQLFLWLSQHITN